MWGGVTLAQGGPPSVAPGTAAENCQRIISAGYSPHNYIYSIVSYSQRLGQHVDAGIDYFHDTWDQDPIDNPGAITHQRLYSSEEGVTFAADEDGFRVILGSTQLHSEVSGYTNRPGQNPDYVPTVVNGELLAIDGSAFGSRTTEEAVYQGLDAYRWRPTGAPADGSGDTIYRDRQPVNISTFFSTVETEWVHNPNWNGPDAARMSAIWGDAAACAR